MTADTSLLSDAAGLFFKALFQKTDGNASRQISMYDIGHEAGLDKAAAARIAEELMTLGLIDIRTLSGGVGLTEEGCLEGQRQFTENAGISSDRISLGNQPVLSAAVRTAVEDALASIKLQLGNAAPGFDDLAELIADIRTIDAQLASPKPKTAIVRECLISMAPVLSRCSEPRLAVRVNTLLSR